MPLPSYRIEHHQPRQIRVLAFLGDVHPHHRTLDLYSSQLRQQGKRGWVRLVDDATGEIVVQRRIESTRRANPSWHRRGRSRSP